ncbi:MAG: glycosyltransferase family 39 protein [Phycisphaerae bacterium]|nr:glycosyltransferase family 39 protein [Phycisphaerae bacterium]MDD5381680.1 glycosyltransferase family 39 protein [Phycisphaerae bacterium]
MCQQKQPQYQKVEQKKQRNFLPWLAVVIVIAIIAGLRVHLLDVPLERDEGEYAYAGQLILQGVPPYSLIYNMKFPGIYAAYALILAIFGQTHPAIHFGLLIINAATIILVFLLARRLTDSFSGVFAAAVFAVLSLAPSVQGISANAEHFVVLFAVAGILLLVLAVDRKSPVLLLVASILLGIGFLMKQHGIAFIAFAGLYLFSTQFRRKPFELKPFLLRAALFIVGVLLPFGITCFILWRVGVFEKFWFWTFVYAREYVSIVSIPEGLKNFKSSIIPILGSAVLIWISAGIGLLTLFIEKKIRDLRLFIIGFLLFSFLSTCPGFYFRPHYFVLLLPAVALLSGVGLFGIRQVLRLQKAIIGKDPIAILLGIAILSHTLYQQKNLLLAKDPAIVSRIICGPINPFPESLKIADYIKANSSSSDRIVVLGSEPQIYFYANRRSATSYVYAYPLMEPHPYALQMQEEMIRQIEAAKPKFLILVNRLSWAAQPTSEKMILNWGQKYQEEYYRLVGFIDIVSTNYTIYHWNENAVEYTPRSEYWLAVFERKSGI